MKVIAASLLLVASSVACGSSDSGARPQNAQAAPESSPEVHENCDLLGGVGPRLGAVDNSFGPDCLTVRSDAVLYVQNLGKYDHTFTISAEEFGKAPYTVDVELPGNNPKPRPVELSGVLDVGTYEFFCRLHGAMDGTIEVIAPTTS